MDAQIPAWVEVCPKIGDLVGGKYRIEGVLGRGGMGIVFEAVHRVTDKRFALKWLLPELAASRVGRRRFIREAKAASRLRHPGVVEIYDVEQQDGQLFLIMELLLGESLEDRLARVGALAVASGVGLLLPCMRGIARAHAAGIVHRDLKPANILVSHATEDSVESAKVLDFGISHMASDLDVSEVALTQSGTLLGTPSYMAPEQLRAVEVDHRADIFAFGVILYETFAGRRPFEGVALGELVLKIVSERPPPLHQLNPAIDPEMAMIVQRAMERRPEDRFQQMTEFVNALERHQAPAAVQVRASRATPAHPALRTAKNALRAGLQRTKTAAVSAARTRWLTLGSALLLVLGVGIALREFTASTKTRTSAHALRAANAVERALVTSITPRVAASAAPPRTELPERGTGSLQATPAAAGLELPSGVSDTTAADAQGAVTEPSRRLAVARGIARARRTTMARSTPRRQRRHDGGDERTKAKPTGTDAKATDNQVTHDPRPLLLNPYVHDQAEPGADASPADNAKPTVAPASQRRSRETPRALDIRVDDFDPTTSR